MNTPAGAIFQALRHHAFKPVNNTSLEHASLHRKLLFTWEIIIACWKPSFKRFDIMRSNPSTLPLAKSFITACRPLSLSFAR
jgi:hypothetical protein